MRTIKLNPRYFNPRYYVYSMNWLVRLAVQRFGDWQLLYLIDEEDLSTSPPPVEEERRETRLPPPPRWLTDSTELLDMELYDELTSMS